MLFNSYIFILVFLPVTLAGFYLIGGKGHHRIAISWLVFSSLFFYGWWNPAYLGLLIGSILVNYAIGIELGSERNKNKKTLLIIGIVGNLTAIGYFKYANFLTGNLNWIAGTQYNLEEIILPLAISFFTFQQIAYLVDAYYGKTKEYNFLHYCLFVTFFPQLIAGPIVHHKEMMPQFLKNRVYKINHLNYAIGIELGSERNNNKKTLLIIGIVGNLTAIGYFKYANFLTGNLNWIAGTQYNLETIILPLAISFFTFQQIAYLVDAYYGKTKEYNFLHYCLFVTFFPQLIAGPIVHHKEMMPQFLKNRVYKINHLNIAIGITIFTLGLFKKVILADSAAEYATPIFNAADAGVTLSIMESWTGALAYTFQLYFDFSGYSDMAIGLARMFGIRLPINFNSPYKATNIIDFWRRWHITLSRFLRDYLYFPLGGNRHGQARRYTNLMIVMLLGGLWHGAGWTFVLWGLMHGMYISVNHLWHKICVVISKGPEKPFKLNYAVSYIITFVSIVIAWVPFRASNLDGAIHMLTSMFNLQSISELTYYSDLINLQESMALITLLALIVWLTPNTLQIMYRYRPTIDYLQHLELNRLSHLFKWRPTALWAIVTGIIMVILLLKLHTPSEFLYFQF